MLRAMSTYTFVHERLNPSHLDALRRGGAQAVEIFCARGHFDYTSKSHIKEIAAWLQTNGVELNSLHSPMYSDEIWGRSGPRPPPRPGETEPRLPRPMATHPMTEER